MGTLPEKAQGRTGQLRIGGMPQPRRWAAYACIAVALGLVLLTGSWAAHHDIVEARRTRQRDVFLRLRSHADRSAGHVESQLGQTGPRVDLAEAGRSPWLRTYWDRLLRQQPERLYAAIVDAAGEIMAHSQPEQEGKKLQPRGYVHVHDDVTEGVYETRDPALTGGRRAMDVQVPILLAGATVGTYHSGLNADWLDAQIASETAQLRDWWAGVIGVLAVVVLLSSVSLYGITRHATRLEQALDMAKVERAAEISQLAIGLAHEIRNPLNAIRLNLHTFQRVYQGRADLPQEEVQTMLAESAREIERLDELMGEVLGYARTGAPEPVALDLWAEVQTTVAFLKHRLDGSQIAVRLRPPDASAVVRIERSRLRQILLNLVTNACEAVPQGGQIDLAVVCHRDRVELTIADDGAGVPSQHQPRIFEPFFSTKDGGTGLGLALVRKFVEEADGEVRYEDHPAGRGSLFRVSWPRWRTEEGTA
jgi:two-component system sensor histidine kinase HydH